MSRGFHSGPVFGIFGAAVAAAKIQGLDANQTHSAIAQCVNLAAGNLEGARSGGKSLREGGAVRNALLAVAMGKQGKVSGETTLEGDAGFYHAYTGNNRGVLSYSYTGDTKTDLGKITEGLGKTWIFPETLFRIYSTAGYNIAHIDVTAALCTEHDIKYKDIDRIEAVGQLVRDRIPEPGISHARIRRQTQGSQHAVLHRVRRGDARLSVVARVGADAGRHRSARGARSHASRHDHSDGAPHAVRAAHHGVYEGRQELYEGRHRPRIHFRFRRAC
jgi:hypothetical protein